MLHVSKNCFRARRCARARIVIRRARTGHQPPRRRLAHGVGDGRGRIAKCEQSGGGLTVAVVDRQGQLRAPFGRGQCQPAPCRTGPAQGLYGADSRRTSADWAKATEPGSRIAGQRSMAKVVPLSGGVPIKAGGGNHRCDRGERLDHEQDEICSMAGSPELPISSVAGLQQSTTISR